MPKKKIDKDSFTWLCRSRWRIEKRVFEARIRNAHALKRLKNEYFDLLWHVDKPDGKMQVKLTKIAFRIEKSRFFKTHKSLWAREQEQTSFLKEAAKQYRFRTYDRYTWRNYERHLCKRSLRKREELKRAWALATKASVQTEISWVNSQLGSGPGWLYVTHDIMAVM